jgi:hypothetical protein
MRTRTNCTPSATGVNVGLQKVRKRGFGARLGNNIEIALKRVGPRHGRQVGRSSQVEAHTHLTRERAHKLKQRDNGPMLLAIAL